METKPVVYVSQRMMREFPEEMLEFKDDVIIMSPTPISGFVNVSVPSPDPDSVLYLSKTQPERLITDIKISSGLTAHVNNWSDVLALLEKRRASRLK